MLQQKLQAHPTSEGEEHYFTEKKEDYEGVVLRERPLEESKEFKVVIVSYWVSRWAR